MALSSADPRVNRMAEVQSATIVRLDPKLSSFPLRSRSFSWFSSSTNHELGMSSKASSSRGLSSSYNYTTLSRPRTGRPRTARPRTGLSTLAGVEAQKIIAAVSESRGVSPTIGLAFVNIDTGEAVLCQICDSQTYVRTLQKMAIFGPSELLIVQTAARPKSKLYSIIEEALEELDCSLTLLDRKYFTETTGLDYIRDLAFEDDVDSIQPALTGKFYAICCFAAALKFVEHGMQMTLTMHSLRIRYEPSEGAMMIDISTIYSLELIQNLHNPKSPDCLFGLLNETQTPMGSRLLRSNILQPLTDPETITARHDALEELTTKEDMFFAIRQVLNKFIDVDKLLTSLIMVPVNVDISTAENDVNDVILLKHYIDSVRLIYEALVDARSSLLSMIRDHCAPRATNPVESLINSVLNDDVKYSKRPLDLRNQRTFAVRSGANGLLDVARTTYQEGSQDVLEYVDKLKALHGSNLELKYDNSRLYYLRFQEADFEGRDLPPEFVNVTSKRKGLAECLTLELKKINQKIADSHNECVLLSNETVQALIAAIRDHASSLFRICESLAMLDMICSFAQLTTSQNYVRPELSGTLAIKAARHPIKEKFNDIKFIPNDVYATQQKRFQIVTGCNMSGKSTYIRSIALTAIMAQIGSFVPATYAALPIHYQLFARVNFDDCIEANMSTFAAEMRETAYILRNIDRRSIAIIDELGRGTSTRDGLAIAIAISEALVESRALIWFVTHFTELAKVMAERPRVVALHLATELPDASTVRMLYRVASGPEEMPSYGLILARTLPLPPSMLTRATEISRRLEQRKIRDRASSKAVLTQKRRRLILELREHLVHAQKGRLEGEALSTWLKELQIEFVKQMAKLDEEYAGLETGPDDGSGYEGENAYSEAASRSK